MPLLGLLHEAQPQVTERNTAGTVQVKPHTLLESTEINCCVRLVITPETTKEREWD